jgi:hypothetical protein
MSDEVLNLKRLFQVSTDQAGQILGKAETYQAIKEAVEKVPGLKWPIVTKQIQAHLEDALDMNVFEILLSGWRKYRNFQQYRDRTKFPPNQTSLVPLGKHTIQSVHKPTVDVMADEVLLGRMAFDVTLSLEIEGLILAIRDARIREIAAGRGRGEARLACAGVELIKKEIGSFDLPGKIDLQEGIEIPGP